MKDWTGTVEAISDKDWNNIKLWSFRIEGEDRWFRTAKIKLPAEVGDKIKFEERNNQVIADSVSVISSPADGAKETASTKSALDTSSTGQTGNASAPHSPNVANTSPDPTANSHSVKTEVGARIQWQAARADACNVIVAALHMDALPWASNVAKGKKLDLLRGYIKEMTEQFLEDEHG